MKAKIALVGLAHFLIQSELIAIQNAIDPQSAIVSAEIKKESKDVNSLPAEFLKIVDSDGPTSMPVPTHETFTSHS